MKLERPSLSASSPSSPPRPYSRASLSGMPSPSVSMLHGSVTAVPSPYSSRMEPSSPSGVLPSSRTYSPAGTPPISANGEIATSSSVAGTPPVPNITYSSQPSGMPSLLLSVLPGLSE